MTDGNLFYDFLTATYGEIKIRKYPITVDQEKFTEQWQQWIEKATRLSKAMLRHDLEKPYDPLGILLRKKGKSDE